MKVNTPDHQSIIIGNKVEWIDSNVHITKDNIGEVIGKYRDSLFIVDFNGEEWYIEENELTLISNIYSLLEMKSILQKEFGLDSNLDFIETLLQSCRRVGIEYRSSRGITSQYEYIIKEYVV
jgi:hypothetical protein